jgi:hypothetical protein
LITSLKEGGTPITSCHAVGDVIIVGKEDSIWQCSPFLNFKSIPVPFGISNHKSVCTNGAEVFLNFNGQIYQLNSPEKPLTDDIRSIFAAEDTGVWDVRSVYNKFNREVAFSCGKKLFICDIATQAWRIYTFTQDVKVLGNFQPGKYIASLWTGIVSLHTAMSIVEEDLVSDYVLQLGDSSLAITNHFNADVDIISTSALK